ncbi:response regulator [Leeuwenhoekiella palythoae]|uniref:Response regulator receiver domain-containing protein n=1 Tax=Leeuwenhoekiella palythoae TaxID=573501 RepID=A0A1M5Y813_9FLAO|nr:response regulator [Leeuwenhoekiella palythoae]MAS20555.1 response regulator [Leeuwenhoekiella sp.]MBH13048.1 response regulator [Leeuwenhoekiella sp.]RXG30544.1 response regulator receiver domain-containing protein [Leeuwenhoekiella palythoae]UBZ10694.1 response regulator [Leeuwenhoekiella palythoae]SHI08069.1 Response regulator receiver domain-containing protein [Leeuwenhoekiella palythoae]
MAEDYILSIEDNNTDIALMNRIFQKNIPHYGIKHISDGQEAVAFLESEAFRLQQPKLVLLDIKVPRLNGLQILKKFRKIEAYLGIPVVMMSSSDRKDEIIKAYKLGANSFIEKPRNYPELSKALPALINYWIVYNK